MHSSKPRSAHRSTLKHGRQACSNTTSANHTSRLPCRRATSARSCRTRSPHQGEDLRTSDSKNLRRGEALLMSDMTTVQRLHVQRTPNVQRAVSAITASRTASQVKAAKCPSPCDQHHRHRTGRIRDPIQEDRRSMVDCHMRRGECTAMCNSSSCTRSIIQRHLFCACLSSAGHFWGYLRMYGMYTSNLEIFVGTRCRREYGLEQFIGASPSPFHTTMITQSRQSPMSCNSAATIGTY